MRTSIAVAILALGATAHAAKADFCKPTTLEASGRLIETLDHGAEGDSRGDMRIGELTLSDGGAVVGEMFWKLTLMRPGGEGKPPVMLGEFVLQDDKGALFASFVHGTEYDYHDTGHRPMAVELAVTGGSGAYQGVSGEVGIAPRETPIRVDLAVTCKGG